MQLARPVFALDPHKFGRAPTRDVGMPPIGHALSDDFKLFAATFAAGFLFVSILIS